MARRVYGVAAGLEAMHFTEEGVTDLPLSWLFRGEGPKCQSAMTKFIVNITTGGFDRL